MLILLLQLPLLLLALVFALPFPFPLLPLLPLTLFCGAPPIYELIAAARTAVKLGSAVKAAVKVSAKGFWCNAGA